MAGTVSIKKESSGAAGYKYGITVITAPDSDGNIVLEAWDNLDMHSSQTYLEPTRRHLLFGITLTPEDRAELIKALSL